FAVTLVAPAVGEFVTPAIVSVVSVETGTEQVPALSASVTVTVVPEPAPVAGRFVQPAVSAIAGFAGSVKPFANVAVIVSPAPSAPPALVVVFSVHVAFAPTASVLAAIVTALGADAAAITTLPGGLAAFVSALVSTVKPVLANVAASGLTTLSIVS